MKRVISIICLSLVFTAILAIINEDMGEDDKLHEEIDKNIKEDERFFENDVGPDEPRPDFDKDYNADFPPDDEIDLDELQRSDVIEYEEGDQASADQQEIDRQVKEDNEHPEKYEIGDEDPLEVYMVSYSTLFKSLI